MIYEKKTCGDMAVVNISGRLTFRDADDFKRLVVDVLTDDIRRLIIDLSGLKFIDSFAISMLLCLQEEIMNIRGSLSLFNPRGEVKAIFKLKHIKDVISVRYDDKDDCALGSFMVIAKAERLSHLDN